MSTYWLFVLCSAMMTSVPADAAGSTTPDRAAVLAERPRVEVREKDDGFSRLIAGLVLGAE